MHVVITCIWERVYDVAGVRVRSAQLMRLARGQLASLDHLVRLPRVGAVNVLLQARDLHGNARAVCTPETHDI